MITTIMNADNNLNSIFDDLETSSPRVPPEECTCDRSRARRSLKFLPEDDLLALIIEGEAVVDCYFCHTRYVFEPDELLDVINEMEAEELRHDDATDYTGDTV